MDQAPPPLALALIEAPVVEVLEDQHPQDHGGWCPQPAPTPTQRMAPGQGLGHAIDEDLASSRTASICRRVESQSLSASGSRTSTRLRWLVS